jgi:hypothetical protein
MSKSDTGFIYSLIRKAQEEGRKEMTLLLDEVDKGLLTKYGRSYRPS